MMKPDEIFVQIAEPGVPIPGQAGAGRVSGGPASPVRSVR